MNGGRNLKKKKPPQNQREDNARNCLKNESKERKEGERRAGEKKARKEGEKGKFRVTKSKIRSVP